MHFHYVLSMGAVFALFGGFYYWTPKIVGRNVNDFLGKIHFWTLFIGVNLIGKKYFYLGYTALLFMLSCTQRKIFLLGTSFANGLPLFEPSKGLPPLLR